MLIANIFAYKIYLVYWIAWISCCFLFYLISGGVQTIGKTVVCICVLCYFSVIWQSKWDLTVVSISLPRKSTSSTEEFSPPFQLADLLSLFILFYWISGEVHTKGKSVVSTCIICCFSVIWQSKCDRMLIINMFVYKISMIYWTAFISCCNLIYLDMWWSWHYKGNCNLHLCHLLL